MPWIAISTPSRAAECTASRMARGRSVRSIWLRVPARFTREPMRSFTKCPMTTAPGRLRHIVHPTYRLVPYAKTVTYATYRPLVTTSRLCTTSGVMSLRTRAGTAVTGIRRRLREP